MFTGYGGLDMACLSFFGADLAWYAEVEPAACRVLAAHYPGVANLGDVSRVDWSDVEPVDVITAGYPCQPFSTAGKRKGKNDERHLYPFVSAAIGALGPRHVVLENVAGHLSMGLADVIGDLAGLGYDARWGLVRASDAGAPHQRARVFIVASDAASGRRQQCKPEPLSQGDFGLAGLSADAVSRINGEKSSRPESMGSRRGSTEPAADADGSGSEARVNARRHGAWLRVECVGLTAPAADRTLPVMNESGELLPTPTPFTNSNNETPEHWLVRRKDVVERTGTHHGLPLAVAAWSIAEGKPISQKDPMRSMEEWCQPASFAETTTLLTPYALSASAQAKENYLEDSPTSLEESQTTGMRSPEASRPSSIDWGQYEPAIRRWERLTRPAPAPTIAGANGKQRLSPSFVEWMMGLPEGHVTGHGLSNAQALKMLGNGVVPQQAYLALGMLA